MKIDISRPGKRSWCRVKIHEWDVNYARFSIAIVIASILKKYKKLYNGTPYLVYREFFGEHSYDFSDEHHEEAEKAWEGILDKIIWSMEEFSMHNPNEPKIPGSFKAKEWTDESGLSRFEFQWDTEEDEKKYNAAMDVYEARLKEGCDLLGKYFRSFF